MSLIAAGLAVDPQTTVLGLTSTLVAPVPARPAVPMARAGAVVQVENVVSGITTVKVTFARPRRSATKISLEIPTPAAPPPRVSPSPPPVKLGPLSVIPTPVLPRAKGPPILLPTMFRMVLRASRLQCPGLTASLPFRPPARLALPRTQRNSTLLLLDTEVSPIVGAVPPQL